MVNNEVTPVYRSFDEAVAVAWREYWDAIKYAERNFREASAAASANYQAAEKAAGEIRIQAIASARTLYGKADAHGRQRRRLLEEARRKRLASE